MNRSRKKNVFPTTTSVARKAHNFVANFCVTAILIVIIMSKLAIFIKQVLSTLLSDTLFLQLNINDKQTEKIFVCAKDYNLFLIFNSI